MFGTSHRSGRKIILVGVIVGALVGGVVTGFALGPRLVKGKDQATANGGKTATEQQGAKEAEPEERAQIVILGEFTVNVRANGALRYLQAEVALAMSGLPEPKGGHGGHGGAAPAPALLEADAALAKDRVVAVLSAADFHQAGTPEGRDALKRQLAGAIAKALPAYRVHEVLFTSFVMQ